jgi:hypothetical protein
VNLFEIKQTDGFTCGPTTALVASALLDPVYEAALDTTPEGFAREQHLIHKHSNVVWPRRLGTTPWGVAAAISKHSVPLGVRYGWRLFRGAFLGGPDRLDDVIAAVDGGWPVGLLIGKTVPRHWVLFAEHPAADMFHVYNPASGALREVTLDQLQRRDLHLGFPQAFALVLPTKTVQ